MFAKKKVFPLYPRRVIKAQSHLAQVRGLKQLVPVKGLDVTPGCTSRTRMGAGKKFAAQA